MNLNKITTIEFCSQESPSNDKIRPLTKANHNIQSFRTPQQPGFKPGIMEGSMGQSFQVSCMGICILRIWNRRLPKASTNAEADPTTDYSSKDHKLSSAAERTAENHEDIGVTFFIYLRKRKFKESGNLQICKSYSSKSTPRGNVVIFLSSRSRLS